MRVSGDALKLKSCSWLWYRWAQKLHRKNVQCSSAPCQ